MYKFKREFTESFRNVINREEYGLFFKDDSYYVASSKEIADVMPKFLEDIKKDMMKKDKS